MKSNRLVIPSSKYTNLLTFTLGYIIVIILFFVFLMPESFAQDFIDDLIFVPARLSTTTSAQTVILEERPPRALNDNRLSPEVYIRKRGSTNSSRLRGIETPINRDLKVEIPDPWLRSPGELEFMVRFHNIAPPTDPQWHCCLTVDGQAIPEEALPDSPEFSIERVYIRDEGSFGIRDILKVAVVIKNNGGRSGSVKAGVYDMSRDTPYIEGAGVTIPSQQQREINLDIPVDPQSVRSNVFTTTFFLLDPNAISGLISQLWRDSNSVDNDLEVSFPMTNYSQLRNVSLTIRELKVKDDCDNVSVGEWVLFFVLRGKNIVGGTIQDSFMFPESGAPRDVDTGDTIEISKQLVLNRVDANERLVFNVSGIECDSDSWLPFRYLERHAYVDVRCDGEDFPELSGAHDFLGPSTRSFNIYAPPAFTPSVLFLEDHANSSESCDSAFRVKYQLDIETIQ